MPLKLKLALYALLLLAQPLRAQVGAAISGQALTPGGTPASNANVWVCAYGAAGTPCAPTVTIYADPNLTVPIPQPYSTDQYGNYNIWVPNSTYLVQIQVSFGLYYGYFWSVAGGSSSVIPITVPQINWIFYVDGKANASMQAAIQGCMNNAAACTQAVLNGTAGPLGCTANPGCRIVDEAGWLGAAADNVGGPWDFEIPCNGVSPNVVCTVPTTATPKCSTLTNTTCNYVSMRMELGPWPDFAGGPFVATPNLVMAGDALGNAGTQGTVFKCTTATPVTGGCFVNRVGGVSQQMNISNITFFGAASNVSESAIWYDTGAMIGGTAAIGAADGFISNTFSHVNFNNFNGDTIHLAGGANNVYGPVQTNTFDTVQIFRTGCVGAGFALYLAGNGGSNILRGAGNISTQPCPGTGSGGTYTVGSGGSMTPEAIDNACFQLRQALSAHNVESLDRHMRPVLDALVEHKTVLIKQDEEPRPRRR